MLKISSQIFLSTKIMTRYIVFKWNLFLLLQPGNERVNLSRILCFPYFCKYSWFLQFFCLVGLKDSKKIFIQVSIFDLSLTLAFWSLATFFSFFEVSDNVLVIIKFYFLRITSKMKEQGKFRIQLPDNHSFEPQCGISRIFKARFLTGN